MIKIPECISKRFDEFYFPGMDLPVSDQLTPEFCRRLGSGLSELLEEVVFDLPRVAEKLISEYQVFLAFKRVSGQDGIYCVYLWSSDRIIVSKPYSRWDISYSDRDGLHWIPERFRCLYRELDGLSISYDGEYSLDEFELPRSISSMYPLREWVSRGALSSLLFHKAEALGSGAYRGWIHSKEEGLFAVPDSGKGPILRIKSDVVEVTESEVEDYILGKL